MQPGRRQKNEKAEQAGKADPDRNEQFRFTDRLSAEFLTSGYPVISVDTKKKENFRLKSMDLKPFLIKSNGSLRKWQKSS